MNTETTLETQAIPPLPPAHGSADDLRVVIDDGETQIWWEDIMCLGSGEDLGEARSAVVDTVASILKQLPHLSPPNNQYTTASRISEAWNQ